ncbi:MAG: T9SS type A sorting domain-containing protein [bacterium]|nr:T9SS type A sorting domain-containing protein [bacterium]
MLIILFIISQWTSFLNSSEVNDIVSNGDKIYAATTGGGLIFDKEDASFTHITNVAGLLSNNVARVSLDLHGNLWFLCVDGGITLMSPDMTRVRKFIYLDGLSSYSFSSIFIDGDTVWVGTSDDKKVWIYDTMGDPFEEGKSTLKEIKPTNEVNDIEVIGDSIWFATNKGIGVVSKRDTIWTVYNTSNGLPNDTVTAITSWGDCYWAGTPKGIAKLTPIGWEVVDTTLHVYEFCSTDTSLWAATSYGVFKWSGVEWINILSIDSRSIVFDSSLWVGTWGEGIAKYDGDLHSYIPDGPASNYFSGIALDLDANIWCTHHPDHKISRLYYAGSNWRWKIYNKNNDWGFGDGGPYKVIVDGKNNKWILTWDWTNTLGIVKVLPNDSIVKFRLDGGGYANVIGGACIDWADNLWVGCWDGYIRRIRNDSVDITISNEYTSEITALSFDLDKNLWVGTDKSGLTIFLKDGGFYRIPGLPIESVTFINIDKKGEIWVGTVGGVYRIKDKKIISSYTSADMGGVVWDMTIESRGGIWFPIDGAGIKKLNSAGTFDEYGKEHGLVSENCKSVEFDKYYGILWVSTDYGLSRFATGITPPPFSHLIAYPNPFVLSKYREIEFSALDIKGGKINIYTLSGRFVKSIENIKSSFATWDGRNLDNEFVASGIYIFVAYTKDGVKKVGKIAVVR